MTKFTPFADDSSSLGIGKLTVENGTDRVALYGTLDLTRDRKGLALARALKAVVDQTVQRLESDPALPDAIPGPALPKSVANPFG